MSPSFSHAENWEPRPLTCPALILTLALALGIALSSWLHFPEATAAWRLVPLLVAASGACLLGAVFLFRAGREGACALVVLAGFAFAGAALPILFAHRFPPNHVSRLEAWGFDLERPLEVEGRVLTEPIQTPSGLEFDLGASHLAQAESADHNSPPGTGGVAEGRGGRSGSESLSRAVSGKIRVHLESLAGATDGSGGGPEGQQGAGVFSLHPGDAIRALTLLRRPRVYQNPGSFDFRKRAADMDDLYWEGSVSGAGEIHKLDTPSGLSGPSRWIWRARLRIRWSIDRLYPPWSPEGRDGAVLKAILLGDRTSLDSATIDHFRSSGLYHLLVIAGLHVGLIAALILGFLRLLRVNRTGRNVLLLLILLAYSLLVEQRAPTLRATLMIVAFIGADLLNRDHTALNSVGLAAIVLLLVRPVWLFESGFQLSFAAALLIVGLAGPLLRQSIEPYRRALAQLENVDLDVALNPRQAQFRLDLRALAGSLRRRFAYLERHPLAAERVLVWPLGAGLRLVEIAALSAVLQIGLLLPMVETFHRVTLAGIGLNSLALPLMALLLAIAIPTVALAAISPAWAFVPGKILAIVFKALFRLAELPHLPAWLSYRVPSPPLVVALGFALSLIALALCVGRSRAGALASTAAFGVFATLLATEPFAPGLPSGSLELTALDCGRGQASFVVFPGGSTALIGACSVPGEATSGLPARWDPGENIVAPYLWSRRVKNVDVLIAPGQNLDGIRAILEDFHVRELWLGPQPGGWDLTTIAAVAGGLRRGTSMRPIAAGEELRLGGTSLEITALYGGGSATERGEVLSFSIARGPDSALLAGTVSSAGSPQPDGSGRQYGGRVLIVDRPGLGAVARSDLLQRIAAEVAITSPGRTMREDSASRRELAGLDLKIPVLSTDVDGAVSVNMKDGSIEIRTFREGRIGGVHGR